MSSHYIIRDEQSPGLLILDPDAVEGTVIPSLLEWAPTVMITQKAINYVHRKNFKIDALYLYEVSPEHVEDLMEYQRPYEIYLTEEKSVVHDTRDFLDAQGVTELNIIGCISSGLCKEVCEHLDDIETTIYCKNAKYFHVKSGHFSKWTVPGHGFFVNQDITVKTEGLNKIDSFHFKSAREGRIQINSDRDFWLGEIIL